MRKILAIARNDIKMEFSERSTLLFFIVLPMLFTWIIGLAMQGMFANPDEGDSRTPLVVVNLDQSAFAGDLITFLNQSDMIRVVEKDAETARDLFANENISAMLVIPADFSTRAQSLHEIELPLTLNPTHSSSPQIKQAVLEVLEPINRSLSIAGLGQNNSSADDSPIIISIEDYQKALDSFNQPMLQSVVEFPEQVQSALQYNSSFQLSSPGQLVTWVLVSLSGTAVLFVNERKYGTLRRLLITPTQKATILSGKILGRVGMGVLQMSILILFGKFVLDVNWGSSPLALAAVVISFAFTGTSLGLFLGTYAKTTSQASGLSTLVSLLLASLGGAWWPLEITPHLYQQVVKIFPSTWAMQGFNRIILGGQGLQGILLPCAILWGYTLIFFMLSIGKLGYE